MKPDATIEQYTLENYDLVGRQRLLMIQFEESSNPGENPSEVTLVRIDGDEKTFLSMSVEEARDVSEALEKLCARGRGVCFSPDGEMEKRIGEQSPDYIELTGAEFTRIEREDLIDYTSDGACLYMGLPVVVNGKVRRVSR